MKPTYIIIHHSASPMNTTFESINEYHRKKWNFKSSLGYYTGYQYIITNDGKINQGRADTEPGAHCKEQSMNYKSIGICVTGWFDDGHNKLPSQKQQDALRELLTEKMTQHTIPLENVKFHRDFASYKSCPGYHITKEFINNLINMKNYHLTSELEKALEEHLGKIDGDTKAGQKLLAGKFEDFCDFIKSENAKFETQVKDYQEVNEKLQKVNKDLDKANQILAETIDDMEKKKKVTVLYSFKVGKYTVQVVN